jgi:hypothetical protein
MAQTTLSFANAVGRKNLADAVGVGPQAVTNAVKRGRFPSSWYVVGQSLASKVGVQCDPELFGMVPDITQSVKCGLPVQKVSADE